MNLDQKHWEKIGKSYAAFWQSKAKQEINKRELAFINESLQKTNRQSVLDIGVGAGRIIENYLTDTKVREVYGIDWAKSMVDYCANKFKADKRVKRLAVADISREDPFSKKFDFISAIRVLKYNQNWQEIIGKMINKLNPGGVFVFTMPNKNSLLRFTRPETAIYKTTQKEIERLSRNSNGQIIEIAAFFRLPDIFYDLTDNKIYTWLVLLLEDFLRKILGDIFLGREFFVAVRKK